MGLLDTIMPSFLAPVSSAINTVVDRLVPDNAKSQEMKDEINKAVALAAINSNMAQLETNKAEASNASTFVAGWRPSIGWVCSAALAYQFVIAPIGMWTAGIIGHPVPAPPMLDDTLWQLMFGMLGMGGLRTYEKIKGVAGQH